MNIRNHLMRQTGFTAKAEGWTESKLIQYMTKRGATDADKTNALEAYRGEITTREGLQRDAKQQRA